MKKIIALVIALLDVFMLASCGSKQEETKMISSNEIKMSGKHKNMVTIASDSIKFMLVCVDEEDNKWDVRAILPIGNTKIWTEIPSKELKGDGFEYLDDYQYNIEAEGRVVAHQGRVSIF